MGQDLLEGLKTHELREPLTAEVHARPFAALAAPERATFLAMLSGEAGAAADRDHVAALFRRFDRPPPEPRGKHVLADLGPFRLKWERHTEYSSYTFFVRPSSPGTPFSGRAIDEVPRDWLEQTPGEVLVAMQIELLPRDAAVPAAAELASYFSVDNFAGGVMTGGAARTWIDFAIDGAGYGRALVCDQGLRPHQAGRLVQRLCEIETYRMLALLAFPLAQAAGTQLTKTGGHLTEITRRMGEIEALVDERHLLDELTQVSGELERVGASTSYRFGAARAYHALVRRRIEELREERIEGYQTITEFMQRRLAPAMRTCEAVAARMEALSDRVARASELLRTRIDVQLEAQNQQLLASMDRRARLQLRLQETVEGLSVVAISYYLVSLIGYLAKAGKSQGLPVDDDLVAGVSVPFVALLVWLAVRRVRRMVTGRAEGAKAAPPG